MKKNQLLKVAALMVLCCVMLGCGKYKNIGSIYGTVTDFATGDPVGNANVRLNPKGATTLTGYDGTFQFNDLKDGNYSLSLSKNGYVDLDDDYVIEIMNGASVRRDVQLNSQFQSFILLADGVEVDTLDFGMYTQSMPFLIKNTGTVDVDVHISTSDSRIRIEYGHCWYSTGGFDAHIKTNEGYTVVVNLFDDFYSIGYVYVSSGSLSKRLVVKGF